jgi:hypothetical protein
MVVGIFKAIFKILKRARKGLPPIFSAASDRKFAIIVFPA